MRFRLFIIMMALFVLLPTHSRAEIDNQWRFWLRAGHYASGKTTLSHLPFELGTDPDAIDGIDGHDQLLPPHRFNGNGWIESADITTSVYKSDIRSPMQEGELQIWHLYAHVVGQSTGAFDLMGYTAPTAWIDSSSITVSVYDGYFTSSDYQLATPLVSFQGGLTGTQYNPSFISRLFYTNDYKDITVVAKAVSEKSAIQEMYPVPETSSLLALFSGITALGLGRLRRRR